MTESYFYSTRGRGGPLGGPCGPPPARMSTYLPPPPPQKVGSSAPTTRPGHLSSGSDWNKTRRWNGEEEERKMKMKEEEEEKKNW